MSVFYKAPSKKITRGMNLTEEPEFGLMVGVDAGIGFTADAHTGSYIFLTQNKLHACGKEAELWSVWA